MAEGREGSSTSYGVAPRTSDKAIIDFLLESDLDLSSLGEESLYEEDEKDISIDSETVDDVILEEHEDIIIDNIDEETSEAPEAFHQTVEKDTRKDMQIRPRQDKTKEKNPKDKYKGNKWQKEQPFGGMKRKLFAGVPRISTTVATGSPTLSL